MRGYTIIEVMIFLAVTSAIFVSAGTLISGQQAKTQFYTGIQEIEAQIRDIVNDTATGYYNTPESFACSTPSATDQPVITGTDVNLGSHNECVFVGKALHFAPNSNQEQIGVYTLIGRRSTGTGSSKKTAIGLNELAPRTLDVADSTINLPYGIKIVKAKYNFSDGNLGDTGGLVLMQNVLGGSSITSTQEVDIFPIIFTHLGWNVKSVINTNRLYMARTPNQVTTKTYYDMFPTPGSYTSAPINPDSGVKLCFESSTTNQHAQILLGGSGRQVSTSLKIVNGKCPSHGGEVFTDD